MERGEVNLKRGRPYYTTQEEEDKELELDDVIFGSASIDSYAQQQAQNIAPELRQRLLDHQQRRRDARL